jgi:hypothetical protein
MLQLYFRFLVRWQEWRTATQTSWTPRRTVGFRRFGGDMGWLAGVGALIGGEFGGAWC